MSTDRDRLREELGALLDGALPDDRAAALRRRLDEEPELRREYEELERTVAAVRALGRTRAPDALREGLAARLDAPARGRVLPMRRIVAAAATIALATTVAFLALRDDAPARTPRHTEALREAPAGGESKEGFADTGKRKDLGAEALDRAKADADREVARLEAEEVPADGMADDEARAPRPPQEKKGAKPAADATLRGPAPGAKGRDQPSAERQTDLLVHVETGGQLTVAERLPYILRLDGAEPARLDRHLEALVREREIRERSFAQVAGQTSVAEVRLRNLAEAKSVRALLERRFRKAPEPPPPAETAGRARVVTKGGERTVDVTLETTPDEARRLLALLGRLDTVKTPAAPAAPRGVAERRGGRSVPSKKAKSEPATRPVTIRLRYDVPRTPAPESEPDDK